MLDASPQRLGTASVAPAHLIEHVREETAVHPGDTATRRSVSDWVARAAAASDPAEVERCVQAAAAQAAGCHEWREVLRGAAQLAHVPRASLAALADRTLEVARAEREVWGFRDVAAVRTERLGDEAGARAALAAAEATFQAPRTDVLGWAAKLGGDDAPARGLDWVLLARGYVETLHDAAGMRRCLESGRDMARAHADADDLCAIASEWAERIDRAEGLALLAEAEALAANGSAYPWTLANAWRALSEPDAARRVLDRALGVARTTAAALHVAKAWRSHGMREEASRALTRAAELAKRASEWLDVAEAAFDAGLDADRIREAVARADALATDDVTKGRVSMAYATWLKDAAAAARTGPRGVPPEALRARVSTLPGWEASASALFDALRARATPEVLASIAAADYGMDAEKHRAALEDICRSGLVPRALAWEPHEVLALTRWSAGERVNHVERALSCVLLCLVPSDSEELVTNGPILAESCLALGAEATHAAELFFAWRAETEPASDASWPTYVEGTVALLLLFLLRVASSPGDARLVALAQRIVERDGDAKTLRDAIAGSMRAELWEDLFDRVLVPLRASHAHVADVLRVVGRG